MPVESNLAAQTEEHPASLPSRQSPQSTAPLLRVHTGCEFRFGTEPGSEFLALVEPPALRERVSLLRSERLITPPDSVRIYLDQFGNRFWRLTASAATLDLRYDAEFAVPDLLDEQPAAAPQLAPSELPDAVMQFTLASRFCESDLLLDQAWQLFGQTPQGSERVQAICDWVHAHIAYGNSLTGPTVSARETLERGSGVCRDFAHLPIAFCRALNIPARYAFGYLPDYEVPPDPTPMDFHAWFEVYLGGRWYTYDARHNRARKARVKIAHGRDAVDVAMITSFGTAALQSMTVWAEASPLPAPEPHALRQA